MRNTLYLLTQGGGLHFTVWSYSSKTRMIYFILFYLLLKCSIFTLCYTLHREHASPAYQQHLFNHNHSIYLLLEIAFTCSPINFYYDILYNISVKLKFPRACLNYVVFSPDGVCFAAKNTVLIMLELKQGNLQKGRQT